MRPIFNLLLHHLLLFILMSVIGCRFSKNGNATESIEISYHDKNGNLIAIGFIDGDSLQVGEWKYFKDSVETSRGNFTHGQMIGRWSYNYSDFTGTIDWDTITALGKFQLNYSNELSVLDNTNQLLLSTADSTIFFRVYGNRKPFNLNNFIGEEEQIIQADSMLISKSSCHHLTSGDRTAYILFSDLYAGTQAGLYYATIIITNSEYLVVSIYSKSFERNHYQYIMTLYLGMVNNLFQEGHKIIDFNKVTEAPC